MRRSNLLRTIVGLLMAALFIYFAFRGISFKSLLHDALRANYWILILTVLVVLLSHFFRALRWRAILQELKSEISLIDTWGSIMVGYLFNNFIPRLGEVVRGYTTGRLEKVSVSGVFGTIVLERLFDMMSSGILFGIALFLYKGSLVKSFPFLRVAGIILVAASVAVGGVLYAASISEKIQKITMRIITIMLPKKFAHKVESMLLSFLTSFRLLRSGKRVGIVSFYTAVIWLVYVFTMYIPFFAFPFGARLHLTFYDAFLLLLVTTIAWALPTPGGMGVYHLLVSQALVIISGVSTPEALTYATLTYFFGYIAITIVGSIFAFIFMRRLKIGSLRNLMKAADENDGA